MDCLNLSRYDYKSDMWAAGCILYELCCLRYPFDGTDLGALVVAIMRGRYEAIPRYVWMSCEV